MSVAEGSFARAHSSVLRLVLVGASLAVAWAVVGAIYSPGAAQAAEPESDTGSLAAAGDVLDVLPVVSALDADEAPAESTPAQPGPPADSAVVPAAEAAPAPTAPEPAAAAPESEPAVPASAPAASVAVPVGTESAAPASPVGGLLAPVEALTVGLVRTTDQALAPVVEVATSLTVGATGLVGTVTSPLLNTLAPSTALLASAPAVAPPVAVAPAAEPAPAVALPGSTVPTRAASHGAAAVHHEAATAAPQGAPLPNSPLAPGAAAFLPYLPVNSASTGGGNGIPTVAAETHFGTPNAPSTSDTPLVSPHEAPPAPAPSSLDSPPD